MTSRHTGAAVPGRQLRDAGPLHGDTQPVGSPAELRRALARTGRGKHVGPHSYYHAALLLAVPGACRFLRTVSDRFTAGSNGFNVVKLGAGPRLSLLRYEDFAVPFPALLAALVCDLDAGTARSIDYAARDNPPILHRKELLLPADHPLVPGAAILTARLETLGAFADTRRIGTRDGWRRRLAALGVDLDRAAP